MPQHSPLRCNQYETNFAVEQVEWSGMEWSGMERNEKEWNATSETLEMGFTVFCVSVLFQTDTHQNKKNNIFPTQPALNKQKTFRDTVCVRDCRTFTRLFARLVRKARPKGTPKGNLTKRQSSIS